MQTQSESSLTESDPFVIKMKRYLIFASPFVILGISTISIIYDPYFRSIFEYLIPFYGNQLSLLQHSS